MFTVTLVLVVLSLIAITIAIGIVVAKSEGGNELNEILKSGVLVTQAEADKEFKELEV